MGQVDTEREDEKVEISWSNTNTAFPDGTRVPLELRLYWLTEQTLLHTEVISQSDPAQSHTSIPYTKLACGDDTPCMPWHLGFSLTLAGQRESSVQGLLDTFTLLPPVEITVKCEEACLVTWCLRDQQHFQVKVLPSVSRKNEDLGEFK